jgi:hypothetical protein
MLTYIRDARSTGRLREEKEEEGCLLGKYYILTYCTLGEQFGQIVSGVFLCI